MATRAPNLRVVFSAEKAGVGLHRHCSGVDQIGILDSAPTHVPLVPVVPVLETGTKNHDHTITSAQSIVL